MKITKVLSVLACLGLALTFVACPGPNEPGVNPEVAANAEAKANKEAAANKEAKANAVALANADAAYDKLYGAEERANREEYNNELARGGNPQRPVPTKSLAKLLGDFKKEAVASDLPDIKNGLVTGVNEYKVTDVAGLKKIAELVNGGEYFSGKTITQVNDIVVNNCVLMKDFSYAFESNGERADIAKDLVNFEGIGNINTPFCGTFDGNGYTIKGLYIYQGHQGLGLFGGVNGATIKNVTVVDAMVVNMNTDDSKTNHDGADDDRFGGLIGIVTGESTIENCTYVGIVGSKEAKDQGGPYEYIGAIIGRAKAASTVKNCIAITKITGDGLPLNKKADAAVTYENSFGIDLEAWTVQTDATNTKGEVDLDAIAAVNPKVAALAAAIK